MPDLISSNLAFDRGIDSITYTAAQTSESHLPDAQKLLPPNEGIKQQLSELLTPTTEDFLAQQLKPELLNRELVLPGKFTKTLGETRDVFSNAAEKGGSNEKVFNRAARQLKDESELRDLAFMYRSALYQG